MITFFGKILEEEMEKKPSHPNATPRPLLAPLPQNEPIASATGSASPANLPTYLN